MLSRSVESNLPSVGCGKQGFSKFYDHNRQLADSNCHLKQGLKPDPSGRSKAKHISGTLVDNLTFLAKLSLEDGKEYVLEKLNYEAKMEDARPHCRHEVTWCRLKIASGKRRNTATLEPICCIYFTN